MTTQKWKPDKIREEVKVNILKSKLIEIPSRNFAIKKAILMENPMKS